MDGVNHCSLSQHVDYIPRPAATCKDDYKQGKLLQRTSQPADSSSLEGNQVEDSASSMIFSLDTADFKANGMDERYDAACTVYKKPFSSPKRKQEEESEAIHRSENNVATQMHKGFYKTSPGSSSGYALISSSPSSPPVVCRCHSKTPRDGYSATMAPCSADNGQVEHAKHKLNGSSQPLLQYPVHSGEGTTQESSTAPTTSEASSTCTDRGAGAALEVAAEPEILPVSSDQDACSVFFARVPPTVPYQSILALFQHFGVVQSLNLFRPWASAKTSKGCGIVEYEEASAAMAAMSALHTKYHWTGGETTMVVEWMDPARHRKDRQGNQDAGAKQATRSSTDAPKPSKGSRKKNNKPSSKSCSNLNIVMALPNVKGASCRMIPGVGLANGMSVATYAAHYPWMVDMAARQAHYNALGAAAGFIGIQGFDQAQLDGLVDGSLGAPGGNMPLQVVPMIAPRWGSGVPMGTLLPGMHGVSSTSQDGSCQSWPMSEPLALPPSAAQAAAADSVRVANLLLQQQHQHRQTALNDLAAARPDSVGSHQHGYASQGDLQQMLENLSAQDYLAGLGGLGASADAATTAGAAAATTAAAAAAAAAGVNYHAAQLLQTEQLAIRSLGSSAPGCMLFDGFSAPNSATAAAAAAVSLFASGSSGGPAIIYGSANSAPLSRIAARSAVPMPGGDACSSSAFNVLGHDLSPMTAAGGTPAYFQQSLGRNHALSNLNPRGLTPNIFNMASTGAATAANNTCVAITGNDGLVQYMMPAQTNMSAGGSMGNLLATDIQWSSL